MLPETTECYESIREIETEVTSRMKEIRVKISYTEDYADQAKGFEDLYETHFWTYIKLVLLRQKALAINSPEKEKSGLMEILNHFILTHEAILEESVIAQLEKRV